MNLQTEVKKKVLLDNEYLSFRWTGGFEAAPRNGINTNNNNNNNNNNFNQFNAANGNNNNQFNPTFNQPPLFI